MCPLKGGAMKQTDDGKHWVHILCALWIPELYFGSGSLREPVFGFGDVGRDRFRLNCYICGQKHKSACIQCYSPRCYAAFHVTCAQQAGLCMYLGEHHTGANCTIEAYCHLHTPKWSTSAPFLSTTRSGALVKDFQSMNEMKQKQAPGGAEAKKAMTIPSVLPDVLHALLEQNRVDPSVETAITIRHFWMLKRRSRRGVPLLRSMQESLTKDSSSESSAELVKERKRFQYVRMQLEKTRMLVGQSLRRERIKRDQLVTDEQLFLMKVMPMRFVLEKTMEQFAKRDPDNVFANPVDLEAFPEYGRIVANPMDMATMANKIERNDYTVLTDFIADFQLMCENAILFNGTETWWHQYAIDMLLQGNSILEVAGEFISTLPIDEDTGRLLEEEDRAPTPGAALADIFGFSKEMVRDALATMPPPRMEDDRSTVIPMSPTSPLGPTAGGTPTVTSPWSPFATPASSNVTPNTAVPGAASAIKSLTPDPNPAKAMGTALQFALGGSHAPKDADARSPPTSPRRKSILDYIGVIDGVSMQLAVEAPIALPDTVSPASPAPTSVASSSKPAVETNVLQAVASAPDDFDEVENLAADNDLSPPVPAASAADSEDASPKNHADRQTSPEHPDTPTAVVESYADQPVVAKSPPPPEPEHPTKSLHPSRSQFVIGTMVRIVASNKHNDIIRCKYPNLAGTLGEVMTRPSIPASWMTIRVAEIARPIKVRSSNCIPVNADPLLGSAPTCALVPPRAYKVTPVAVAPVEAVPVLPVLPAVDVSMYEPVEFMLLKEMLHTRQLARSSRTGKFRVLGSQLRMYRQNTDSGICEKLRRKAGIKKSPAKETAARKKDDAPKLPPLVVTIRPGQVCWAKMAKFPWHPAEVFDTDPEAVDSSDPGGGYKPDSKILSMCPPESRGAFGDCRGAEDKKKYLLLWFDKKRSWVWLTKSSLRAFNEDPRADMAALNPPKTQPRVRAALPSAEKQWKRFRAKERQSKAKKRAF
jgi:hypothetical protein